MSRDPAEARACRALWAAVIITALNDAITPAKGQSQGRQQAEAHAWLRAGPSLLLVASLAGIDGLELRRRYRAGSTTLQRGEAPRSCATASLARSP